MATVEIFDARVDFESGEAEPPKPWESRMFVEDDLSICNSCEMVRLGGRDIIYATSTTSREHAIEVARRRRRDLIVEHGRLQAGTDGIVHRHGSSFGVEYPGF